MGFAFTAFIISAGLWPQAMVTIYLCGVSVVIAMLIGVPLGILAGQSEKANTVMTVVIDTLQTLPTFVYLIPVVMLFKVGDSDWLDRAGAEVLLNASPDDVTVLAKDEAGNLSTDSAFTVKTPQSSRTGCGQADYNSWVVAAFAILLISRKKFRAC